MKERIVDVQISPRLRGEKFASLVKYQNDIWTSYCCRVGPLLFLVQWKTKRHEEHPQVSKSSEGIPSSGF